MNTKINVLITGPMPPPAGGISIHLQRLEYLLKHEFNLDFIDESSSTNKLYFNIKSLNLFVYLKKINNTDLIFIHSGNRLFKKLHIILGKLFGKKVIITIHGYGKKRNFFFRIYDQVIFNLANKIILVNPEIRQKVNLKESKIVIKNAFLPPILKEEPNLSNVIESRLIESKRQNKTIVCANASRLDNFNGEDLYGLDMSIEATKMLVDAGIAVDVIYIVSSLDTGEEKFQKAQHLIQQYQIQNSFFLIHEKASFVKLIEQSDMVIRPTNTDGDSLTIREGLYLNKIVLASDVVQRPEGTKLFKTRNTADLFEQMKELITLKNTVNNQSHKAPVENEQFYSTLLNEIYNEGR
jgi:glycosyltransferase involved in cell wall biosynthesis